MRMRGSRGAPCERTACVARRFLEQQRGQRARGVPQQQHPRQSQRQHRFSGGVFVPRLASPFYGPVPLRGAAASASRPRGTGSLPEAPADHGWRAEAKAPRWRRAVPPARRHPRSPRGRGEPTSGAYRTEAPPGCAAPRGASTCRAHPAAEQPADLGHQAAHVPVLAVVEPAPAMGQAQIQPQLVQRGVGGAQVALPRRTGSGRRRAPPGSRAPPRRAAGSR